MITASRLLLVYLVVESAALIALVATIGIGWTLLVAAAAFTGGIMLAGAQVRTRLRRLPAGGHAVGDGTLVALGTLLVVLPGLVSTAVGLLMLTPVTRAALRPLLKAVPVAAVARRSGFTHGEVIDGEVIDVVDADARALSVD